MLRNLDSAAVRWIKLTSDASAVWQLLALLLHSSLGRLCSAAAAVEPRLMPLARLAALLNETHAHREV